MPHSDAPVGPRVLVGEVGRDLHPDEIVARIAEGQRGVITREQLHDAGIGRGGIARRIAAGRLHRLFPGVYLVGHPVPPNLAIELAATFACGRGSVLSHRSGVDLWQLLPRPKRHDGRVDVSIVGRRGLAIPGIAIHRPRHLDRRDITRIQDIPVTTAPRTLLDFAEVAERRELERAFSEAQARHLISPRKIEQLLSRSHGRRGAKPLAELYHRANTTLSRSDLEDLMLSLIRQAHLPEPDMNVLVLGRYRVDFLWREQRVIAETDGGGWHASKQRRDSDHRRDSDLRAAGFTVERFSDHELTYEPHAAVARLTRAIYA